MIRPSTLGNLCRRKINTSQRNSYSKSKIKAFPFPGHQLANPLPYQRVLINRICSLANKYIRLQQSDHSVLMSKLNICSLSEREVGRDLTRTSDI